MSDLVNFFVSLFGILQNNSIFGMSLLTWSLIAFVFSIVVAFIKGEKN